MKRVYLKQSSQSRAEVAIDFMEFTVGALDQ